jgi:hypothetical protein
MFTDISISLVSSLPWERRISDAYNILAGKPEGNWPFRRPIHVWEDSIKT